MAGRAGSVNQSFPIDFAINPGAIARHSFIAVERGEFDPAGLKGKDVIIGATAIELGDRYAVPRHGVLPGVVIQALAAETLVDAVPIYGSWPAPLLVAALLAFLIGSATGRRVVAVRFALAGCLAALLWLVARLFASTWFEIVPALVLLVLAAGLRLVILTAREAQRQHRIDPESGLPNKLALDTRADTGDQRYFVAAQIDDFDALQLAVGNGSLAICCAGLWSVCRSPAVRAVSTVSTTGRWSGALRLIWQRSNRFSLA